MPPTPQHTRTPRTGQPTHRQPLLDARRIRLYRDHSASERYRTALPRHSAKRQREGRRLPERDHRAAGDDHRQPPQTTNPTHAHRERRSRPAGAHPERRSTHVPPAPARCDSSVRVRKRHSAACTLIGFSAYSSQLPAVRDKELRANQMSLAAVICRPGRRTLSCPMSGRTHAKAGERGKASSTRAAGWRLLCVRIGTRGYAASSLTGWRLSVGRRWRG